MIDTIIKTGVWVVMAGAFVLMGYGIYAWGVPLVTTIGLFIIMIGIVLILGGNLWEAHS